MNLDKLFSKLKGGPGSGNFGHGGRPGKKGGSVSKGQGLVSSAIEETKRLIKDKGLEDQDIYVDKEAKSISSAKSPEQLRKELGDPIRTEILFGKKPDLSPFSLDKKIVGFLEEKAGKNESLQNTLSRELNNAPQKQIPLSSVNISQKYIFKKPLERNMRDKSYGSDLYLVQSKGNFYVHDNNHRVAAAILNNEPSLNFKILSVD